MYGTVVVLLRIYAWNIYITRLRCLQTLTLGYINVNSLYKPLRECLDIVLSSRESLSGTLHLFVIYLLDISVLDGCSTEYHQDAWWEASNTVKYEYCEEVDYAERTVINYWLRYCPWALEFGDWETLARTHNGGPCYWHSFSTTRYWWVGGFCKYDQNGWTQIEINEP